MRRATAAFITAFTLAAALALAFTLAVLPSRLVFDGGESYEFYLGNTSSDCRTVSAERENAALTRLTLSGVCGESATYSRRDAEELIKSLGGEVIFTETLSDSVNYYCRAPLPYSVTLYGEEINLHVCVKADGVTAASPIIFGGY